MKNIKSSTKTAIDTAADATQKAAAQVIDKSKDAVHDAGRKLEAAGKRLRKV